MPSYHRVRSYRHRPRLVVERLEDRATPAVTATFTDGVLTILGDSADDAVVLGETATPGEYTVADASGDLPGSPYSGVASIVADLRDGNDRFTLNGDAINTAGLDGDLHVTGAGTLSVAFGANVDLGGRATITHTGVAALNVTIDGPATRLADLLVFDGAGDSTITVQNDVRFAGWVSLNLGDGTNTANFQSNPSNTGVNVGGFLSFVGGAGNDTLKAINSAVAGNLGTDAGQGSNGLELYHTVIVRDLAYRSANSGSDFVAILNASVVHGNAALRPAGIGGSNVAVQASHVDGSVSFEGGIGDDYVSVTGSEVGTGLTADLGDATGTNHFEFTSSTLNGGSLRADTTGDAQLYLQTGFRVRGYVSLNGGPDAALTVAANEGGVTGFFSVVGGEGTHTLDSRNLVVGENTAVALAGVGTESFTSLRVGGDFRFTGRGGGHVLLLGSASVVSGKAVVDFTGTGGSTSFETAARVGGDLSVRGGVISDAVQLTGAAVGGNVQLDLGQASVALRFGTHVAGNLTLLASGTTSVTTETGSAVDGYVSLNVKPAASLAVDATGLTVGGFFSALGGAGDDRVALDGVTVRENTAAALGDGANALEPVRTRLTRDLRLTGLGDTVLNASDTVVGGTVQFHGGAGHDIFSVNTLDVGGDLDLDLGSGQSQLTSNALTVRGDLTLTTMGGTTATFVAYVQGTVLVTLASRLDDTSVEFLTGQLGGLSFQSADARDSIQLVGTVVVGNVMLAPASGNDRVVIQGSTINGTTWIATGADDDALEVQTPPLYTGGDSRFTGDLTFLGGDGDDRVTLGSGDLNRALFFGTAAFDGGPGADVLDQTFAQFFGGPPTITDF